MVRGLPCSDIHGCFSVDASRGCVYTLHMQTRAELLARKTELHERIRALRDTLKQARRLAYHGDTEAETEALQLEADFAAKVAEVAEVDAALGAEKKTAVKPYLQRFINCAEMVLDDRLFQELKDMAAVKVESEDET